MFSFGESNGKEGADRDKLNVVVGTDRRGPELMGGGTHHGAKTTTSTEYPVPPRCLSTWTVQSMQRGTKFDQFVV